MTRIFKAVEITVWVICGGYAVALTCAEPLGAMPLRARAVAFQVEPVPVSSASPLPSLSQGEQ